MTLNYPANFQAGPGHNWANAVAMATPIAHKGVTAGAKVQAMTALDLILRPELVTEAWALTSRRPDEGQTVHSTHPTGRQTGRVAQRTDDGEVPAREMKYDYDPTKYKTYLDQLGITYPTVR